ncbi:MAG: hypothetical protein LAT67_15020 [Balneolales bacterium]|nr:hypothetical protein [Balneolales bacterium]
MLSIKSGQFRWAFPGGFSHRDRLGGQADLVARFGWFRLRAAGGFEIFPGRWPGSVWSGFLRFLRLYWWLRQRALIEVGQSVQYRSLYPFGMV